jgi:hypothetical protein
MDGWKMDVRLNKYQQRAPCPVKMSTSEFLLNCFVLGDDKGRIFPVKISRNDNVGILKDEIKKKKAHLLSDVDASDLDLWKVCLPIDDPAPKDPRDEPLRVNKRLSSLWDGDLSDDDLHILVKAPGQKPTGAFLECCPGYFKFPPCLQQLLTQPNSSHSTAFFSVTRRMRCSPSRSLRPKTSASSKI